MGISNTTLHCPACDLVVKAPAARPCVCGALMQDMGKNWKPGRKGSRTRMFDQRKAPRSYWGHRQLPFEPVPRTGRKRARAYAEEAIPVRDKSGRLPAAWYVLHQDDPRHPGLSWWSR
jgi:hypothetical protein